MGKAFLPLTRGRLRRPDELGPAGRKEPSVPEPEHQLRVVVSLTLRG
jgi:hypothetical protein